MWSAHIEPGPAMENLENATWLPPPGLQSPPAEEEKTIFNEVPMIDHN